MKKLVPVLTVCFAVQACAAVPNPIVEKEGVSASQMNRDLADCRKTMPAVAVGNPIAPCMQAKGYKVLDPM